MEPKDSGEASPPITTWTHAEPHEGGEHLHATGLEDYGYWLRWMQSLPAPSEDSTPSFRRGLIWR